jgi:glyoxalase family protein
MESRILRLHHVTATVTDPHEDVWFYTRILGLRLVKKTVNFDHSGVYHFYYGDRLGQPSTLMTTFPYGGQGVRMGVKGAGQVTVTSFSVPPGSLGRWADHLDAHGVRFHPVPSRFGEEALMIEDPSGLNLELREGAGDTRAPWVTSEIDAEMAIRGIHGVTLVVRTAASSVFFLATMLGFRSVGTVRRRTRMAVGPGGPGHLVEILESEFAPQAMNGLGTVHHVALAIPDAEAQADLRTRLVAAGFQVTEVRDRQYFQSIYFREPGGVLYEVATEGPGFTVDESEAELGRGLKLPPWVEGDRERIEAALPMIHLD